MGDCQSAAMGDCQGLQEQSPDKEQAIHILEDANQEEGVGATVAIVRGRGFRNADNWLAGKSDCFVVLKVVDSNGYARELYTTKVKNDTLDPVWKEEAVIPELKGGQSLEFTVFDADVLGMRDLLGQVTLDSSKFWERGFNGELKLENAGEGQLAYLFVKVKHKGQGYPPGPPPEVKITLMRTNTEVLWGMHLDSQDGKMLYVDGVEDKGLVRKYNEGVEPAMQLRQGDYLLMVNGKQGDAHALYSLLMEATKAELVVRRAEEFSVNIIKDAADGNSTARGIKQVLPGLTLRRTPQGTCLLVLQVNENWKTVKEEAQVKVRDRIIAVGEQRGAADLLLKELQKMSGELEVTLCRPREPREPKEPQEEKKGLLPSLM